MCDIVLLVLNSVGYVVSYLQPTGKSGTSDHCSLAFVCVNACVIDTFAGFLSVKYFLYIAFLILNFHIWPSFSVY